MEENSVVMDRRKFLYKSATFFAGSLLGLNSFSRALASNSYINQPKMALIIDDIGFSRSRLKKFLEIGAPITFAILPRLAKSSVLAEEIHAQGHEILLHQPMEPFNPNLDPGPGALYVGDKANKIVRIIGENISDVPFVTGINNHMGSRFTARQKEMKEVLKVIKSKGLFFVDSLTTSRSMGYRTAKRLNIAAACRNLFLDNYREEPAILSQLHKLKRLAMRSEYAIGIGHPYPETARAINRFKGVLNESGISMVHISCLIPC
jgi:polysaccharide deacetylase 2 family uncharacterized protein YibQ